MALKLQLLLRSKGLNQLIANSSRSYAYWNKDWRPGPYPETKEERDAAAKKYLLRPEDYKPYPNDGWDSQGDYPAVPRLSEASRDPHENWDHPDEKRNFGEVMHRDADVMREAYFDPNLKYPISFTGMFIRLVGVAGAFILISYISSHWTWFRPAMPKQYPKDGEKHYSFESAAGDEGHGHGKGHGHH